MLLISFVFLKGIGFFEFGAFLFLSLVHGGVLSFFRFHLNFDPACLRLAFLFTWQPALGPTCGVAEGG